MIKKGHFIALSASVLLVIPATGTVAADTTTVEVVEVTSGDTLTYRADTRSPGARQRKETLRLYGVDAPERGQPRGEQARRFVADRLLGKTIKIKRVGKGAVGSPIAAWAYLGKGCVNEWLLKNGLAWWDRSRGPDKRLEEMETEAREAKRGLWADPKPVEPWKWRAQQHAAYLRCLKRCTQRNAMRAVAAAVVLADCRRSCTPGPTRPVVRSRTARKSTSRARGTRRRVVRRTRAKSRTRGKDEPVEVEVLRGEKVEVRKLRRSADSKRP
jgi:endonuclease YncB( thermonuclease family)